MAAVLQGKFSGNIMDVIALVDSRHDFGDTSKDYAKEIGPQFDCFQNFTNNIQRIKLFGNELAAKGLSQRLTSTCKGRGNVLGGSPEAEFVNYVEEQIGLPPTPGNLDTARTSVGGLKLNPDGQVVVPPAVQIPSGGIRAGGLSPAGLGGGFIKIIIPSSVRGQSPDENYDIITRPVGGDVDPQNYKKYHRAIARALGWDDSRNPIPVVVDTTKSLQHSSDPYFIICRNRENVTDPGPSSDMFFPFIAEELVAAGAAPRTYPINNVSYVISGPIDAPTITYRLPGMVAGIIYTYGARGNKSPNSIEVCKGKIKDAVDTLITAAGAAGAPGVNYYQTWGGGDMPSDPVAKLIALFNKECGIYNSLGYRRINEGGDNSIENKIVVPYVAKRGGDQLQVESCNPQIRYVLKRRRNIIGGRGAVAGQEYVNVDVNGNVAAAPFEINIQNCVFWTYDRVAAMYAVLRGITTVLQSADKTATIYKRTAIRNAVTFQVPVEAGWPPLAGRIQGGGRIPRPLKGGAVCTRRGISNAETRGNVPIGDACFNEIFENLCTPGTIKYDPFTLLNFINYYLDIYYYPDGRFNNPLTNLDLGELEVSIDGCITTATNWGVGQVQPGGREVSYWVPTRLQDNARSYKVLFIPGVSPYRIDYTAGDNKSFIVHLPPSPPHTINLIGVGGALNKLTNPIGVDRLPRKSYFNYISDNIAERGRGRAVPGAMNIDGGGQNFYQKLSQVQTKYEYYTANELFIEFFELLSICENEYFLSRDSADNFYVYNPLPVLHGGHTQYEMMAFFDTLIKEYNNRKSQPSKLDTLLKCFIYFPFLLKRAGFESILVDLSAYISLWFEFEMIMDNDIEPDEDVNKLFASILNNTSKKLENLQSRLTNSDEECADYLHTIFPHGYFVIKYNEIKPITNTNKKNTNATPIKNTGATINSTNMNNIITKMQRLSIKNKSLRPMPGRASINTRSQTVGGKHLTKKKRKNKRKTHKKRKY